MYAKIIPSRNCFSPISPPTASTLHAMLRFPPESSSRRKQEKMRPQIVCLSCLLFHLSMNEIIISHEKFPSENKNIIGTSIFIMAKIAKTKKEQIFHLNFYTPRCRYYLIRRAVQLASEACSCLYRFICWAATRMSAFIARELLLSC